MKVENSYVCPATLEFAKKCAGLPKGNFAEPKTLESLGSCNAGSGHDCYLKGVTVTALVTASQSWWLQWMRYHHQDIVSSTSKMYTIINDDIDSKCSKWTSRSVIEEFKNLIGIYNDIKDDCMMFPEVYEHLANYHGVNPINLHELFQCIVHSCPMGFELTAGITTNYLQCKTVYNQRHMHKMDEWKVYCEWIECLPEFSRMTGLGGELLITNKKEK